MVFNAVSNVIFSYIAADSAPIHEFKNKDFVDCMVFQPNSKDFAYSKI